MFRGIAHEYPGHLMACSVTLACAGCAAFFLFRSRCIPLFTPSHYETLFRSVSFFHAFPLPYRFARRRFLSFSIDYDTSAPRFLPKSAPLYLSFLSSFYSTAAGCSSHVVAETRRLSISIRSSRRPLCNLSADDVTTSAPKGTNRSASYFYFFSFYLLMALDRSSSQFCARAAAANSFRTYLRIVVTKLPVANDFERENRV